jgi:hypothetical protein
MLAGIATCGVCGRRLYASTRPQRTSGKFYRRYACESHVWGIRERCGSLRMPADMIDAMFVASIDLLLPGASEPRAQDTNTTETFIPIMRRRIIDAAIAGDHQELDATLAAFIKGKHSLVRTPSTTVGREYVELIGRLERWDNQGPISQTDASLEETRALNHQRRHRQRAGHLRGHGQVAREAHPAQDARRQPRTGGVVLHAPAGAQPERTLRARVTPHRAARSRCRQG